jgi:hypothetical protein
VVGFGLVVVVGCVVVAACVDVGAGVGVDSWVVVAGADDDTTGAGLATGGEVAWDLAATDFFDLLDALCAFEALCFLAFWAGSADFVEVPDAAAGEAVVVLWDPLLPQPATATAAMIAASSVLFIGVTPSYRSRQGPRVQTVSGRPLLARGRRVLE